MRSSNTIVLVGGLVVASEIVWQLYKRYSNFRKRRAMCTDADACPNGSTPIADVMFFAKGSTLCRAHANELNGCRKPNCAVKYLRRLISYMDHAKRSVDVCMHVFTCQALCEAVVNAHKRGVLVRVVTDRRMMYSDESQIAALYASGVAVRTQNPDVLMHHKFVVVDGRVAITGSSNWTMTAFFGNFENVLVTNQLALVEPFVGEFEKLWTMFDATTNPTSRSDGGRSLTSDANDSAT